jgi:hypothetical protein
MSCRTLGVCAVAAGMIVAARGTATAQDTAVELRVGCVLASNTGQEVDQRLVDLRPRFARLFRYTSYNLVKEKREKVTLGGKMFFEVPGGRYLMILPKEYHTNDGSVLMKVVLLEGARPIVNTAVSLKKHGTFLVGGPQNNDGALILSIAADDIEE